MKPAFAPILLFDPGGAILPPRPQSDCAIVSSGGQGWPRFSRPPEGLVLDGREHDGTLAVSERKTTMRGSGARLVITDGPFPVPVPAVTTEVRELQSGSPSITSISRPSNWVLLLTGRRPLASAWAHSFPHRSFTNNRVQDIGANGERVDALL